jgi:hypothetical protein
MMSAIEVSLTGADSIVPDEGWCTEVAPIYSREIILQIPAHLVRAWVLRRFGCAQGWLIYPTVDEVQHKLLPYDVLTARNRVTLWLLKQRFTY